MNSCWRFLAVAANSFAKTQLTQVQRPVSQHLATTGHLGKIWILYPVSDWLLEVSGSFSFKLVTKRYTVPQWKITVALTASRLSRLPVVCMENISLSDNCQLLSKWNSENCNTHQTRRQIFVPFETCWLQCSGRCQEVTDCDWGIRLKSLWPSQLFVSRKI